MLPSYVRFDGRTMIGRLTTPEGKSLPVRIGERTMLTGPVVPRPRDGRYGCTTERLLIADAF